jgi:hypothetical protein
MSTLIGDRRMTRVFKVNGCCPSFRQIEVRQACCSIKPAAAAYLFLQLLLVESPLIGPRRCCGVWLRTRSEKKTPQPRARTDAALVAEIRVAHDSHGTYGAPGIHVDLAAKGIRVGRKRVTRLSRARNRCDNNKFGGYLVVCYLQFASCRFGPYPLGPFTNPFPRPKRPEPDPAQK